MVTSLDELILKTKRDKLLFARSEEATKQGVVLPFLVRLDWDRDNISEVEPEYSLGNGRVDYCLKRGDEPMVFVEVKRAGEPLESHQKQLLRYAFDRGVNLAALTDGMRWWLYLPTSSGSWAERRFFTIDLEEQPPEDAAANLQKFLHKSAVLSGGAVRAARELHESAAKLATIERAIPRAWEELLEGPDEGLIELLSDKVEARCGYRADPETVEGFLVEISERTGRDGVAHRAQAQNVRTEERPRPGIQGAGLSDQWANRKPESFTLFGEDYPVDTFKKILLRVGEILSKIHPEFATRVSELRKPYYTEDRDRLVLPGQIGQTTIYMETNIGANEIRNRCYGLLRAFGHQPEDLQVKLQPKV